MAPVNPDLNQVQDSIKNTLSDIFILLANISSPAPPTPSSNSNNNNNNNNNGNNNPPGASSGSSSSSNPGPTPQSLSASITTLDQSLLSVYSTASSLPPQSNPSIPLPLMEYVENGRNPDIYTREFVELVRRLNQLQRGKSHAFRDFRDVLADVMVAGMPELREDVERVMESTGGRRRITGEGHDV
ncbi:putative mediator of RNA polymerase II transcription subunit 10 [Cladorrhinum samala]|uniref:Mediator of RNA polymerase II transcription subunit 10 n=1 Tax=Cladorrhinum samala TaxID=585594 RepID=A0AAV9HI65_9PEZI|nr:putative mediator of RNA polymerase II transcription subunit 10 [Cladorrhinum samala]